MFIGIHALSSALLISIYDLRFHRIPRRLVHAIVLTLTPFMSIASLKSGLFNLSIFLLLYLLLPTGIGFGDVRLSFIIGKYLSLLWCFDIGALLTVDLIAMMIAGAIYLTRIAPSKRHWGRRIAFAPPFFLSLFLVLTQLHASSSAHLRYLVDAMANSW